MGDELASMQRRARWRAFGALSLVGIGVAGLLWIALRGLPAALGGGSVPTGRPVGEVRVRDASGRSRPLAEYRGQVLLVDVWATWCPPCRRSLPEIAALQKASDGRYKVIAISVDREGWAAVEPFLQANPHLGLEAVVPDSARALAPFGEIAGIPTTFIVDRQGRISAGWSGYYPGRAERELKKALGA